jgi:hypothetical protein
MEVFGGNWNYGQGVAARDVGDVNTTDGWYVLIGRKADGGTAQPRGRKIILGGSTTDVTAASGLADGSTPGADGILQVGKWGTASEFLGMDVAAVAAFGSDLSDGTTATFTTDQAILDASPAWCVAFDQANAGDAIEDDSATGTGDSSSITGTTIVADPSGFFASGGAATLTPATAAFSAVAVTPVPQPVTIALTTATATFGAVALSPVPQPVTVALSPAGAAFSAVAVIPVPQPVSVALSPAVLALSAVPLAFAGAGAVTLTPAALSLTGIPLGLPALSLPDPVPVRVPTLTASVRVRSEAVAVNVSRPAVPVQVPA